jgi:SAM-dependent methyltransferase
MRREDWNRRYAEADSVWSRKPNRFLVAEVEGLEPGRALDLACGEGQNAVWLASLGWEVTAVDYADVAVAKGLERADQAGVAVDFHVGDLLDYRPEARAFDLVVILYLHMSSAGRRLVLERAADAVAPGGTLVVIGHDLRNLTEGVGGPSDTDVLFTPDEVVAELPGLEVVKAERLLRDVDGHDRPAIDALVRAVRPLG